MLFYSLLLINLSYTVNNVNLKQVYEHRDLGIIISNNLSWSKHYSSICSRAYQALYFIYPYHQDSLLKDKLVRSKLSFCSQLRRPRLAKDIRHIEAIQRHDTKYILSDYSSIYNDRLIFLNLLPLMYWFDFLDIIFFRKIHLTFLSTPPAIHILPVWGNYSIITVVLQHLATFTSLISFVYGTSYCNWTYPYLFKPSRVTFLIIYGIIF